MGLLINQHNRAFELWTALLEGHYSKKKKKKFNPLINKYTTHKQSLKVNYGSESEFICRQIMTKPRIRFTKFLILKKTEKNVLSQ